MGSNSDFKDVLRRFHMLDTSTYIYPIILQDLSLSFEEELPGLEHQTARKAGLHSLTLLFFHRMNDPLVPLLHKQTLCLLPGHTLLKNSDWFYPCGTCKVVRVHFGKLGN